MLNFSLRGVHHQSNSNNTYATNVTRVSFAIHRIVQPARRRRHRLKGIHSRSDTSRTGAESLSFYYPRLLHCLSQMLAVVLLSRHRVSSSKTVRPRAPCGARCIGHAVSKWSAVCSEAPHSQCGKEARPHLCMDEWNRPTPVRRRLILTPACFQPADNAKLRIRPSTQILERPLYRRKISLLF